jgi:hypothetical protein
MSSAGAETRREPEDGPARLRRPAGGEGVEEHLQEPHHEVGQPEDDPVLAEGIGDGQGSNQHGRHRRQDYQPRGDYLLGGHGVGQPRVSAPRPPQRRQQRRPLDHPDPSEVIGEEAGYLGEGEDEDQVEEQLEGGDALLGGIPALHSRRCRVHRAHPMPSHRPSAFALVHVFWHQSRLCCTAQMYRSRKMF